MPSPVPVPVPVPESRGEEKRWAASRKGAVTGTATGRQGEGAEET